MTDGSGSISTIVVPDNAGRPLSSTTGTAAPIETKFSWDDEGNLKSLTPPGRPAHYQSYTSVNSLASYSPPTIANTSTSFFYNRDGGLEFIQRPGNGYVDYVYDRGTGQLVQDGNAQFSYYTWSDTFGATKGKLQTVQTPYLSQTLTYDGPLLATQTSNWSNVSATVINGYSPELRLQSEGVSSTPASGSASTTASYGYDTDGLLTCASLSTCAPGASNKLAFTYNSITGALASTALGTVSDTYAQNLYGELAGYSARINSSVPFYSVTYDDLSANRRDGFGRVKRETDNLTGDRREYTYDEQGRLSYVSLNGAWVRHYAYDPNGNRISSSPGSTTPVASYDDQDRLLTYNGASYDYGLNGELRKRTNADGSADEFTYNSLGYLTSAVTANGRSVSYSYDGFGRRTERVSAAMSTRYLYRNGLNPVAVLDGNGAVIARFVYGSRSNVPDFMVLGNGTVFRYIVDQLGSPRFLVDITSTGAIAQQITYDEFGNRTIVSNSGVIPALAQPFGFAGGLYDEDTGLVHFGAREYDPVVGRWISKDPILFGGRQANLYAYVGNDPINRSDPNGKLGTTDLIGLYWGLAGWAAGGDAPSIRFDPSAGSGFAIEFTNNPAQRNAGYSTTFGNVICYAGTPDADTVEHELAHTRQYAILGDSYLPAHIESQLVSRVLTGNYSDANVLEAGPYSPEHNAWPWGNWP